MASDSTPRRRGRGRLQSGARLRADEIDDRLCLNEIDATVEKRSPGELTRTGQARAIVNDRLKHGVDRPRAAMAIDLDDVFARIAVRRAHHMHGAPSSSVASPVADYAVKIPAARPFADRGPLEDMNRPCTIGIAIVPLTANDPDAAFAGWRGDCGKSSPQDSSGSPGVFSAVTESSDSADSSSSS